MFRNTVSPLYSPSQLILFCSNKYSHCYTVNYWPTNDVIMNVKIVIYIFALLTRPIFWYYYIIKFKYFINYEFTHGFSIAKPIIILINYNKDPNFNLDCCGFYCDVPHQWMCLYCNGSG